MSNFFYDSIISRLQKENKNWNAAFIGEPGSGKSWAALKICCDLSNLQGVPFTEKNIVFSTADFLKLVEDRMENRIPRGSCVLFDEFAIAADSDVYRGEDSIMNLKQTFETFRTFGLATLCTWPGTLEFAQKKLRSLFHTAFILDGINYEQGFSHARVHWLQPGVYNSKLYKRAPSTLDDDGLEVAMDSLKFFKPPISAVTMYENKQLHFKTKLIRERRKIEEFKAEKVKLKDAPLSDFYKTVLKHPRDYLNARGDLFSAASLAVHLNLPEKKAKMLAAALNIDRSNGKIRID